VYVNAHTHTFQRALRSEGGDFWAWRDSMLQLAAAQTPERVREEYEATYREMRAAGYGAVGEFHYLGLPEGRAAAEAAEAAGVEIVLLLTAYARGGLERMRQSSVEQYFEQVEELRAEGIRVGLAPHSVRACPRDWLEAIGRYGAEHDLVVHIHADEQPREIEECLTEHGIRPIELLHEAGCLGPQTTVVHATHAGEQELDLLSETGSRICVCPTTEADLGDGFPPTPAIRERGIPLCVGSDANVSVDPGEELRELDWIARRQTLRRLVFSPEELEEIGTSNGAAALGLS
jgi:formimidoylglutamate deiminase